MFLFINTAVLAEAVCFPTGALWCSSVTQPFITRSGDTCHRSDSQAGEMISTIKARKDTHAQFLSNINKIKKLRQSWSGGRIIWVTVSLAFSYFKLWDCTNDCRLVLFLKLMNPFCFLYFNITLRNKTLVDKKGHFHVLRFIKTLVYVVNYLESYR